MRTFPARTPAEIQHGSNVFVQNMWLFRKMMARWHLDHFILVKSEESLQSTPLQICLPPEQGSSHGGQSEGLCTHQLVSLAIRANALSSDNGRDQRICRSTNSHMFSCLSTQLNPWGTWNLAPENKLKGEHPWCYLILSKLAWRNWS